MTRAQLLEEVYGRQAKCTRCSALVSTRKQIVRGRGDPDQPLLAVGEGPGADENEEGFAFIGRAGRKLDKMMVAAGLQVPAGDGRPSPVYGYYVLNTVCCWAATYNELDQRFENRKPTPEEYGACRPFLHRMIRIIDPACILLLGEVACRAFGVQGTMAHLQGRMVDVQIEGVHRPIRYCAMPLYHPAHILRHSEQSEIELVTIENLKAVRDRLQMYQRVARGLSPVAADEFEYELTESEAGEARAG